jgi:hypothetical protein
MLRQIVTNPPPAPLRHHLFQIAVTARMQPLPMPLNAYAAEMIT